MSSICPPQPFPFVDRKTELGELDDELRSVTTSRLTRGVLVQGPSGTGKTRLACELIERARLQGIEVLRGECLPRGAEPLHPVREALFRYLKRSGAPSESGSGTGDELGELKPFVDWFLLPVAQLPAAGVTLGGAHPNGVPLGLAEVFRKLAARNRLCLVIEDVEKADQETLIFLTYLVRSQRDAGIFVLVTFEGTALRDEQIEVIEGDWEISEDWTRLELGAFPLEVISDYLEAMNGTPPLPAVARHLQELTGGNPLLLKELREMVKSEGDLGADPELPRHVQKILELRLGHLDDELRKFLQAAAVCLEASTDLKAIPVVLGTERDIVNQWQDRAVELGILINPAAGEVRFVHEAMRLAVYEKILPDRRQELHAGAGSWFEGVGQLEAAAHHFQRAGRMNDAARNALRAADKAVRVGMYHSAVRLYELAEPVRDAAEIGPPMVRALIIVGRWDEAEARLRQLDGESADLRLLWSDLHFVRGDYSGAAREIEAALSADPSVRIKCLKRLAHIHLYVGEFAAATERANEALEAAKAQGSVEDQAHSLELLGATSLYAGDLEAAEADLGGARDLMESIPEAGRDRTLYTMILDNLGQVAEYRREWSAADDYHSRALAMRREAFDARGLLHSLHAVARVRIATGDTDKALELLEEEERLVSNLGEPLEQAKIALSRAKIALSAGDADRALQQVDTAMQGFIECRTAYDVAHAQLTKASILAAKGEPRRSILEAAKGRSTITRKGFRLLQRVFPDLAFSYPSRVANGLYAYACGDAYGLPWEGKPPSAVDLQRAATIPQRPDWPRGSTSDDTALTLIVAESLMDGAPAPETEFMRMLCDRAPTIPGLGPSTSEAVRVFAETGGPPDTGGCTNGAAMRALPIGWAVPLEHPDRHRSLTIAMSRPTHPSAEAQCAACVMSACASWALEGAEPALLLEVAIEEAAVAAELCGADRGLEEILRSVESGTWTAPPDGVSLDPRETVGAVLHCVTRADSLRSGIEHALELGGDTDTVAALTAGLLGCRSSVSDVDSELPWTGELILPENDLLEKLSDGLATVRVRAVYA